MSKLFCIFFTAALCSALATAYFVDKEHNTLAVEEHDDSEEILKPSPKPKCYDREVKSEFKLDSVWYPRDKCEQRICSRQKDSKTPFIKIMDCEPCTTCDSPNEICHPFRAEKKYPHCCPKCLTKSAILKKKQTKLTNY